MYFTLFSIAGIAIVGWLLLILLPTWSVTRRLAGWALFPAFLALTYTVGIVAYVAANGLGFAGDFGSADGVIRLLATPEVALVAWIHILCFDHLVGVVIYRDNMRHRFVPVTVQSVILFFTLMFGPVGFLAYWLVRVATRRGFIDDEADGRSPHEGDRTRSSAGPPGHGRATVHARGSSAPLVDAVPRPEGPLPAALVRTLLLLWSRARLLAAVGAFGVLIATAMVVAALVRGHAVVPEGNLFETATFDAALGIFLLTLAALSPLAAFTPRGRRAWTGFFALLVVAAYMIETVQAFRGLDPRFSAVAGPIDQAVGGFFFLIAQGVMLCAFVVLWKFFSPATAHLPHALRLAVRYGALASVVGFGIGEVMSAVGGRAMGEAGNLLPLHAAGFHGVQAVPLVALLLEWAHVPTDTAERITHFAGAAWLVACVAIAVRSLGGHAVLSMSLLSALAIAALVAWATLLGLAAMRAAAGPHAAVQRGTA